MKAKHWGIFVFLAFVVLVVTFWKQIMSLLPWVPLIIVILMLYMAIKEAGKSKNDKKRDFGSFTAYLFLAVIFFGIWLWIK